jgi:protein TonB
MIRPVHLLLSLALHGGVLVLATATGGSVAAADEEEEILVAHAVWRPSEASAPAPEPKPDQARETPREPVVEDPGTREPVPPGQVPPVDPPIVEPSPILPATPPVELPPPRDEFRDLLRPPATPRPALSPLPDPSEAARLASLAVAYVEAVAIDERNQPPAYPPRARRLGQHGIVWVSLDVDETGRVTAARIETSSGHALLDEAALAALREWCYRPARRGGVPVATTIRVPVEFRLEGC